MTNDETDPDAWFQDAVDKAGRGEPATEAEMLDYETRCSAPSAIDERMVVELRSVQEVLALADALKEGLRQSAMAFPESVAQHASTGAWFDAIAYRLQKSMLEELRLVFERTTGNPGANL